MTARRKTSKTLAAALTAATLATPAGAWAVTCELPLFITTATEPNVLILLDNSGSMNFLVNPTAGFDNYTNYSPQPWSTGNLNITPAGNYTKWCSNLGANVTRNLPAKGFRGEFLNWFFCQYTGDPNDVDLTTRWDVATDATVQLINDTDGVRFGLMQFNSSEGGYIAKPVGSTKTEIISYIDGIFPNTWTPLAETAEDALNYFKDDDPTYSSPIQETCQKNFFVIVTDGEPTQDLGVSSYLQNYYDGNVGSYPSNGSDYLDDVVKYMYDNDMSSTYAGTQNVSTYVIGFNVDAGILSESAQVGHGLYINAYNADELINALETVVADIINQGSSGGAVAVLTTSEDDEDRLFRAKFTPGSWEGRLENYELPLNGDPPVWDAGVILDAASSTSRSMWTALDTGDADTRIDDLVEFTTGNAVVTDASGTALWQMFGFSSPTLTKGQNLITYLRGDAVSGKRDREGWKLGDIVYSSPVVVGPPVRFYADQDYYAFRYNNKTRARHIYVNANDGALHNFDLNGTEQWAFLPEATLSKLHTFWSTSYCHRYYVDGSPKAADVKIDVDGDLLAEWITILVAGRRSGGDAYFALDVTDPTVVAPLWQFEDGDLGESWSEPKVGRVRVGTEDKWVAFVGSGPDNDDDKGYLYAIDLEDGTALWSLKVSDDTVNWLTTPQIVDTDDDDYVEAVYVGDLLGHLWRVNVSSTDTNYWSASLLFEADANQAITAPPAVAKDPGGKWWVYFGTGRYLDEADKTTTDTQSFYGITDPGNGSTVLKADLANQTSADNSLAGKQGWYFDLPDSGDRVTSEADILAGIVFFTAFYPDATACGVGGTAKLYAVEYLDGTAPDEPVLDIDGDGDVDSNDVDAGGDVPKYVDLGDGVPSKPVIDVKNQQVIVQTSDTTIHTKQFNVGANRVRMVSWQERFD